MKLQPDSNRAAFTITAHGPGFVEVNGQRHVHGLSLGGDSAPRPWGAAGLAGLSAADFDALLELRPELVVIGTGARQVFLAPALLRGLIARGIGYELMSTAAACRTYNILVGEGRRAVAALLVDSDAAPPHC